MSFCPQVGEVYLSQALAVVTDGSTVPARLVTQSVAVFMLVVTLIGGNVPLLMPYLLTAVGYSEEVTLEFQAAPMYTTTSALSGSSSSGALDATALADFSVLHTDARQLQFSMMYLLGATYGLSAILYIICGILMNRRKP
jgi:hypothetical protein